jgi:hypothetical protein
MAGYNELRTSGRHVLNRNAAGSGPQGVEQARHYISATRPNIVRLDSFTPGMINSLTMKALLILTLAVLGSSAFAAGPLTRVWTDTKGRQVEATFVRIEGEQIFLQTRDGTIFQFPLANLTAQEQALARSATPFEPPAQGGQVDQLVSKMLAAKGIKPNPPTSDEQFMRRAYLSIVGRIPSYAEAEAFLAGRQRHAAAMRRRR